MFFDVMSVCYLVFLPRKIVPSAYKVKIVAFTLGKLQNRKQSIIFDVNI